MYNGSLQNKYCEYGRKYKNIFSRRLTLRVEYQLDTESHLIFVKIIVAMMKQNPYKCVIVTNFLRIIRKTFINTNMF